LKIIFTVLTTDKHLMLRELTTFSSLNDVITMKDFVCLFSVASLHVMLY